VVEGNRDQVIFPNLIKEGITSGTSVGFPDVIRLSLTIFQKVVPVGRKQEPGRVEHILEPAQAELTQELEGHVLAIR
jgi:hypothetical protein